MVRKFFHEKRGKDGEHLIFHFLLNEAIVFVWFEFFVLSKNSKLVNLVMKFHSIRPEFDDNLPIPL